MQLKSNIYIQRCLDLARLGAKNVSPNPMVGAVIATPNRIIGEGYHIRYGESHAEVNAVADMLKKNRADFDNTSLFVSLEPCNFHGNTPACTNLIIQHEIPRVVISAIDKTDQVNFSGVQKLIEHGLEVEYGILKQKGAFTARVRNTFATRKRPYIILKYAQSSDGFIGQEGKQIWLSNSFSKRLVHKWRAEIDAIIVGKNTVLSDNPRLTTRHYPGENPLRITIDINDEISMNAKLKNGEADTWIYSRNSLQSSDVRGTTYKFINDKVNILSQICADLYNANHSTLLVEGGAKLLQSFIDADLWDEARVITSATKLGAGIASPKFSGIRIADFKLANDTVELCFSPKNVIYS